MLGAIEEIGEAPSKRHLSRNITGGGLENHLRRAGQPDAGRERHKLQSIASSCALRIPFQRVLVCKLSPCNIAQ